jgi:hypothetical protein
MSGYWDFYEETARAVSFDATGRVTHKFAGVKPVSLPGKIRDERWIDGVEEGVWHWLYQWHYLRERRKVPDRREGLTMRELEDPEFVARLSQANRSAGVLDGGWRVVSSGPDECLCEKSGLQLRVSALSLRPDCQHRENEVVTIRFPAERRHWMPLYYCTCGGIAAEVELRVYFNVKPASAAWLLRTLSQELHESVAGYQLKLLNHPRSYTRPDAAVLYVPGSETRVCRAIVDRLMASGTPAFRGAIPALTRGIYPGVAVADEPSALRGRRTSFGEHRCRIVVRGLARAHAGGCGSVTEAVDAICREFELNNIDPAQPYAGAPGRSAAARF